MKKTDFKNMIKESIKEVLIEEGLLATVISEVAKGLATNTPPTMDNTSAQEDHQKKFQSGLEEVREREEKQRAKLAEMRKNMMDSIGKSSYKDIYNLNGVNLFEGTTPLKSGGTPGNGPSPAGPLSDVEPSDPGVDISSLMGNAGVWKELLKK